MTLGQHLHFGNNVKDSLHPLSIDLLGWRRQGQRLNVTAQWHDHLNWERVLTTASMISTVFKDLSWWSGRSLNSRFPAQETDNLSTGLTGRRQTNKKWYKLTRLLKSIGEVWKLHARGALFTNNRNKRGITWVVSHLSLIPNWSG